jgi:biotin carboxyl carrier protein
LQLPGILSEQIPAFRCTVLAGDDGTFDLKQRTLTLVSPLAWRDAHTSVAVRNSKRAHSVKAPMPGRVLRLTTQAGATVDEHDVIAILEAMKMEHRIEAGLSGIVTQVYIKEGDTVPAGTSLFDIAKAEE